MTEEIKNIKKSLRALAGYRNSIKGGSKAQVIYIALLTNIDYNLDLIEQIGVRVK